jgi:hypothetical protein
MPNPPDDESPDPTHCRHAGTPLSQSLRRYHVHAPCRWLPIHRSSSMFAHCMAGVACSLNRDWTHPWCLPLRRNPVPMGSCRGDRYGQWNSLRCRPRLACKVLRYPAHSDLSLQLTRQRYCRTTASHHPRINRQGVRGRYFKMAYCSAFRILGRPGNNAQVDGSLAVLHGTRCRARVTV